MKFSYLLITALMIQLVVTEDTSCYGPLELGFRFNQTDVEWGNDGLLVKNEGQMLYNNASEGRQFYVYDIPD